MNYYEMNEQRQQICAAAPKVQQRLEQQDGMIWGGGSVSLLGHVAATLKYNHEGNLSLIFIQEISIYAKMKKIHLVTIIVINAQYLVWSSRASITNAILMGIDLQQAEYPASGIFQCIHHYQKGTFCICLTTTSKSFELVSCSCDQIEDTEKQILINCLKFHQDFKNFLYRKGCCAQDGKENDISKVIK